MRRAFVVVIDACGVGALPDAPAYGDGGSNTLAHVAELNGGLTLPNLERLGLGAITALDGVKPPGAESAATLPGSLIYGRLHAIGPGKDSTAGHWALMGVASREPLATYPQGFPQEVLAIVTALSGRELICNRPCDGLDAIREHGEDHLRSGALIIYTSQDSVLQIAAHEAVYATSELHELCARVRAELPPEHAVGRVIARPFRGAPGQFERTDGRVDLAIDPPGRSYLDALSSAGVEVHSVGKAGSLFAGRGVTHQHPGAQNREALASTTALIKSLHSGLVFTNLIDTDQVYGHRHHVAGFVSALQEIDAAVGVWLTLLRPGDLLVLTADHGVDPAASHSDHTREYVPLMAVACGVADSAAPGQPRAGAAGLPGRRHDGPMADVGASVLRWLAADPEPALAGNSFL